MSPMLRAKALTRRFGDRSVLRGIDLELAPGECVGVRGSAGSGRSTLMGVLSTLIAPTSGTLEIDGIETRARLHAARVRLAYVGEPMAAGPRMTAAEYLEFCRSARATAYSRRDEVDRVLQLTAIRPDRFVDEIPPAMHWALALGVALVCQPRVVLIDAPPDGEASLPFSLADAMSDLRRQGAAAVVVVDAPPAGRSWCDRIVELRNGALVLGESAESSSVRPVAVVEHA